MGDKVGIMRLFEVAVELSEPIVIVPGTLFVGTGTLVGATELPGWGEPALPSQAA